MGRWLVAIVLIGGLIVGLFAAWPSGSQRGTSLIPADITINTIGVSTRQLAACQQAWEAEGGLSGRWAFLGHGPPLGFLQFMQAADRLAEADISAQLGRVSEMVPLVSSYVVACRSFSGGATLHQHESALS
jgi:hypothetical protein